MKVAFLLIFVLGQAFCADDADYSDKLVFKLDTDIYLLSDINKLIDKIRIFECTLGQSILLKNYGLTGMKKIDQKSDLSLASSKQKLNNVLNLLKTMTFVEKESIDIAISTRNLFIESASSNKCGAVVLSELNYGLLSKILKSELYFKKKFSLKTITLDETEFKKLKRSYPNLGDKQALSVMKEEKQKNGIRDFVSSLKTQIKHREYF